MNVSKAYRALAVIRVRLSCNCPFNGGGGRNRVWVRACLFSSVKVFERLRQFWIPDLVWWQREGGFCHGETKRKINRSRHYILSRDWQLKRELVNPRSTQPFLVAAHNDIYTGLLICGCFSMVFAWVFLARGREGGHISYNPWSQNGC